MPITFNELRKMMGANNPTQENKRNKYNPTYEVPPLPPGLLESLSGAVIVETHFPGCFRANIPVAEDAACYTGAVEIGSKPLKHLKDFLELWPWIGN